MLVLINSHVDFIFYRRPRYKKMSKKTPDSLGVRSEVIYYDYSIKKILLQGRNRSRFTFKSRYAGQTDEQI